MTKKSNLNQLTAWQKARCLSIEIGIALFHLAFWGSPLSDLANRERPALLVPGNEISSAVHDKVWNTRFHSPSYLS